MLFPVVMSVEQLERVLLRMRDEGQATPASLEDGRRLIWDSREEADPCGGEARSFRPFADGINPVVPSKR
ncbi:hypothetical protein DWB63_08285 [Pseudodesulfovibrio sp. S3]|nr:hypothetical protein DWB63_08285 [Pseudodesulfovibrio sp. S3]